MPTEYENQGFPEELDFPAQNAFIVIKSDSADLEAESRGLYIGGAGTLKVDMIGTGEGITFSGVTAGSVLPIRVSKVYSTGTTATAIIALY